MSADKIFQRYVEYGPGTLSVDEVASALQWRDENPAEALAISRRSDQQAREADDKEALRATWELQGGDPTVFEREYKRLRQEHEAAKLAELEGGARGASWRSMWRGF
jgi:hypothetical protein